MTTELKIYGAFRTGSNLMRSLLELNYEVLAHQNNYGYKHIPVPANYEENNYVPFPLKIVTTVKDPFAFIDSLWRYCQEKNYLNVKAAKEFSAFCFQPIIITDSGYNTFPLYYFPNPVQYWNSFNFNLTSLSAGSNLMIRYEDLLQDCESQTERVAKAFNLERKSGEFIRPTGVTKNLADPKRGALNDYFLEAPFVRSEYYLKRQYMENFTSEQRQFITSELNRELVTDLGYSLDDESIEIVNTSEFEKRSLRKEIVALNERVEEQESALRDLNDEVSDGKTKAAAAESELSSLISINHLLEEAISNRELELNKLRENLAKEQKLRESTEEQMGELRIQFQRSQQAKTRAFKALIGEKNQLRDELTLITSKLEDLKSANKARMDAAEKEMDTLKRSFTELSNQLESSRRSESETLEHLTEVKESFSFNLGLSLVNAILKPGRNTVTLPYDIYRHWSRARRK